MMLVAATICVKRQMTRDEITLEINGMSVIVKQGDIFEADGRKIIPFNEYFDTQVDDNVIDKDSLNGKLILEHLDEDGRKALNDAIVSDDNSSFKNSSTRKLINISSLLDVSRSSHTRIKNICCWR